MSVTRIAPLSTPLSISGHLNILHREMNELLDPTKCDKDPEKIRVQIDTCRQKLVWIQGQLTASSLSDRVVITDHVQILERLFRIVKLCHPRVQVKPEAAKRAIPPGGVVSTLRATPTASPAVSSLLQHLLQQLRRLAYHPSSSGALTAEVIFLFQQ